MSGPILRTVIMAAALAAGATLVHAQPAPPPAPPAEVVPAPDDEGRSVDVVPAPVLPAPDDDANDDDD